MVNGVDVRNLRRACFVAGTPVETRDGLRAIDRLAIGDQVLSRHEETGEIAYRTVVRTIVIEDKQIYRLVVADEAGNRETIRTTDEHPFWIAGHGWVRAADLREGDPLLTPSGEHRVVVSLVEEEGLETVHNIEVDEFHTYFVGELRIFVHNADCGEVEIVQNTRRRVAAEGPTRPVVPGDAARVVFDPMGGDKFRALQTAAERREFLTEYARQIRGQEDALNSLTVDQFMKARDSFDKLGRNPNAKRAQKQFTKDFEREVKQSIAERMRRENPQLSDDAIDKMAAQQATAARKGLAALHEPDNVAGGYTSADPTRMGNANVNSSIGPSWNSRVEALDSWAAKAKEAGYGGHQMNVRLFLETGLINNGRI